MKRAKSVRGMSLVEVAAAAVVVAVSLLGTTAAIVSGAALTSKTRYARAAARAGAAILEDVRATDFADVQTHFAGKRFTIDDDETGAGSGYADVTVRQVDNGSTTFQVYEVTVFVHFPALTDREIGPVVTWVCNRVDGSALGGSTPLPGANAGANAGAAPNGAGAATDPNAGGTR
mgnify:CR=1 FL=1